jgi:hypothetical protein
MMVLGYLVQFLTGPAYMLISTFYLKDYTAVQDADLEVRVSPALSLQCHCFATTLVSCHGSAY